MVRNKKAAMEMTMGTVVTIVLLIAVLIMVLFFIGRIRDVGTDAIDGINQNVMSEINKLFSEDNSRKIVVIPSSRLAKIQKGESNLGFGFAIRNVGEESAIFSYVVSAKETSCNLRLPEAENLIQLGKQSSGISIPAGNIMEDPVFVRFGIAEETPPCLIRYSIDVKKDNVAYGSTIDVDVEIISA